MPTSTLNPLLEYRADRHETNSKQLHSYYALQTDSKCKRNWMANKPEINGEGTFKKEFDLSNNICIRIM